MKLTGKQSRFCDEYIISMNATQAAIKAGYSKKTAAEIGSENLRKPNIREKIDAKLKELALTAEETLKSISDIAKSSLNDYFIVREEIRTPQVLKPLAKVIKQIQNEIEDADKFIDRIKSSLGAEELDQHHIEQDRRRRQIIKLEIDLERNPKAAMITNGEPIFVKVAELDMPRLVQDKAAGKIKSIKPTEHGLNVELYAADAALRDMARYHGLFEKDNEQSKPQGNTQLTDDQFSKLLQVARETKAGTSK
jgi:phage terminase small subunit